MYITVEETPSPLTSKNTVKKILSGVKEKTTTFKITV
jgi:hypothetical protein